MLLTTPALQTQGVGYASSGPSSSSLTALLAYFVQSQQRLETFALCSLSACSSVRFAPHHLCGVDRIHLLGPRRSWVDLAHDANVVGRVARNANVVVALQNVLEVGDAELAIVPEPRHAACSKDDIVDEFVRDLHHELHRVLAQST